MQAHAIASYNAATAEILNLLRVCLEDEDQNGATGHVLTEGLQ